MDFYFFRGEAVWLWLRRPPLYLLKQCWQSSISNLHFFILQPSKLFVVALDPHHQQQYYRHHHPCPFLLHPPSTGDVFFLEKFAHGSLTATHSSSLILRTSISISLTVLKSIPPPFRCNKVAFCKSTKVTGKANSTTSSVSVNSMVSSKVQSCQSIDANATFKSRRGRRRVGDELCEFF